MANYTKSRLKSHGLSGQDWSNNVEKFCKYTSLNSSTLI